jgi:hypothetical protein
VALLTLSDPKEKETRPLAAFLKLLMKNFLPQYDRLLFRVPQTKAG